MSNDKRGLSRRDALTAMGVWSAAALAGEAEAAPTAGNKGADSAPALAGETAAAVTGDGEPSEASRGDFRRELAAMIDQTPIVDTHEHLLDEHDRLRGEWVSCDDWAFLVSHYLNSDLAAAGMPGGDISKFLSGEVDPIDKWKLLAPHWPAVKNTGFARAVRIALKELYGVEELNGHSVKQVQAGYEALRQPGFYERVLRGVANIESCQVDNFGAFRESRHPQLLLQDMNCNSMHIGPDVPGLAGPTGKEVQDLDDWHAVLRWWFDKYAKYAVAVKIPAAYSRGLDYEQVAAETAEPVFRRVLRGEQVTPVEQKLLEDHLFWFIVEQATKHDLPVKLHTGYYSATATCRWSAWRAMPPRRRRSVGGGPDTQWVFMHIAYPYWQELLAVAKHYRNAHIDMCWTWIIDPAASTRFLKSHLVTAPANKVFVFGGDYIPVECVVGHARMARKGVTRALWELVEEDYLSRADALELVEPLLRDNAHELYNLQAKSEQLRRAPWA